MPTTFTVTAPNHQSLALAAGEVLTVTAPAGAAASVVRLSDSVGGTTQGTTSVAASTSQTFGPYQYPARFDVLCSAGAVTYVSAPAAFAGIPSQVTMAAAAAASTVCEVTITVKDSDNTAVPKATILDVWLSDAATGAGQTGTTASGTVTFKTASGAIWATHTAKKALKVQTLGTGVFILEITDSAKTPFYVCVQNPQTGLVSTLLLATANYGA